MTTTTHEEAHFRDRPLSSWRDALQDDASGGLATAAWKDFGQALHASVQLLIGTLNDDRPAVRQRTIQALRDLGEQLQSVTPMIRAALKDVALKDPQTPIRTAAAEALGTALDPQSASPALVLLGALKDDVASVRFRAASGLADLGQQAHAALPELIHRAMWDTDERVRVQSAVAAWRVGRRERVAVPVLMKALAADDEFVRWLAADCLGDIGAPAREAVPALMEALRHEYKAPLIRKSIVLALDRIEAAPDRE